jgi:Flp pilus assembly protein TadD
MALCLEQMCPEAAVEAWRHAADLAPADSAIATTFARVAADSGDGEAAIAAMEQLLDYGPQGADFHVTLAWLLLRESRAGDASVEAEVVRAIQPDHPMLADLATLMSPSGERLAVLENGSS